MTQRTLVWVKPKNSQAKVKRASILVLRERLSNQESIRPIQDSHNLDQSRKEWRRAVGNKNCGKENQWPSYKQLISSDFFFSYDRKYDPVENFKEFVHTPGPGFSGVNALCH